MDWANSNFSPATNYSLFENQVLIVYIFFNLVYNICFYIVLFSCFSPKNSFLNFIAAISFFWIPDNGVNLLNQDNNVTISKVQ